MKGRESVTGRHGAWVAGLAALLLLPGCLWPIRVGPGPEDHDDGEHGDHGAFADAGSDDLTELSLEDLMQVDFTLPVTVLGAHTHHEGDFMVGVTRMTMNMRGSLDGDDRISNAEIFEDYEIVHTKMQTDVTMYSFMYAPTDDTTLMVMVPDKRVIAKHVRDDGSRFTRTQKGIGDVSIHALHTFYREGEHRMHFDAGVSLPTGSIDEENNGRREHYMQQLGSGTVDLLPGITYLGETEDWAWGAQAKGVVRMGKNKHDYSRGNRVALTSWIQRRILENLAVSARVNAQRWGNVRGRDRELDLSEISENDPDHQGGKRIDALLGLSYYGEDGPLEGHRIEFEYGWPVYQKLKGPQLEMDQVATLSWKVTF